MLKRLNGGWLFALLKITYGKIPGRKIPGTLYLFSRRRMRSVNDADGFRIHVDSHFLRPTNWDEILVF